MKFERAMDLLWMSNSPNALTPGRFLIGRGFLFGRRQQGQ